MAVHNLFGKPLSPSGGGDGGNIEPMEARLNEVEKAIIRIDGRLEHVDEKFDRVLSGLKDVKTLGWGAMLTIILATIGTGIGIQQMTVASFQAAAELAAKNSPPAPAQVPAPTIIYAYPPTPAASK